MISSVKSYIRLNVSVIVYRVIPLHLSDAMFQSAMWTTEHNSLKTDLY